VGGTAIAPSPASAQAAPPVAKPAVYRSGLWLLRESMSSGPATHTFVFGRSGDFPVMGDWNGDGVKTIGIVRGRTWFLRNTNSAGPADITFNYGGPDDFPVVGDWDGDGDDTPGVVRCADATCSVPVWLLRNFNSGGGTSKVVRFGVDGFPVAADWDNDGDDSLGVVDEALVWGYTKQFGAKPDALFAFGAKNDQPVVGTWGTGGRIAPGVVRGGTWYLRPALKSGPATASFRFGRPGDFFLVWH
jgi:hypothetical protein